MATLPDDSRLNFLLASSIMSGCSFIWKRTLSLSRWRNIRPALARPKEPT